MTKAHFCLLSAFVWAAFPPKPHAQAAHVPPPQSAPQGQGEALKPPDFLLLPAEENYQYLRNPKFVPLNRSKTAYLTLGGEAREN